MTVLEAVRECIGRRSLLLLLMAVLPAVCACVSSPGKIQPVEAPKWNEAEMRTWEEGVEAFKNGDYGKANAVFEVLSDAAQTEHLCRKALYALAATRLAMAQTPDEYEDALGLWEVWTQQISGPTPDEDPRMLTPFIERLIPLSIPENNAQKMKKSPKSITIDNIGNYKNLLQAKEREIDQIKSRLDSREREVKRLRHQIDTLEEIHLKFQERKQEVSSP